MEKLNTEPYYPSGQNGLNHNTEPYCARPQNGLNHETASTFLDQVRHLLPELSPEERQEARQGLMDEIGEYMAVVEDIDRYE